MSKKYDFGIVIGRFQPFHVVHLELVKHALNLSEKVIVVLGSARSAPDVKNPFTPQMREEMISACFADDEKARLIFRAVRDYPYNDNVWTAEVQNLVRQAVEERLESGVGSRESSQDFDSQTPDADDASVALIGHFKDGSSYYLNLFPQWDFEEFYRHVKEWKNISGSTIREKFFQAADGWQEIVPAEVKNFLENYQNTEVFPVLQREFEYVRKYKADTKFVGVPFEPVFVTTDVVVVHSGHVLVIRRGHQPGKGLLALPGGFLASGMTLEDSAIKELKEETNIHVPVQILKGSIKSSRAFDYPDRSQRGRTVTFAFHINLEPSLKDGLPKVKGGDDASKAFWMPLSDLGANEDKFFEDHIHVIRYFLGM